jgi:hypothetical protein
MVVTRATVFELSHEQVQQHLHECAVPLCRHGLSVVRSVTCTCTQSLGDTANKSVAGYQALFIWPRTTSLVEFGQCPARFRRLSKPELSYVQEKYANRRNVALALFGNRPALMRGAMQAVLIESDPVRPKGSEQHLSCSRVYIDSAIVCSN